MTPLKTIETWRHAEFGDLNLESKHDPGGKVRQELPDGTSGTAVFGGGSLEYRYRLAAMVPGASGIHDACGG